MHHSNNKKSKKYYQKLVLHYLVQEKIAPANLIRAYSVWRFELLPAFMIAVTIPIGYKTHFNFFGLNPLTLTKEQLGQRPTLLLHGLCHNQGVWLYLANAFKKLEFGPLFTVNYSSFISDEKSMEVIYKKIASIQRLYANYGRDKIAINIIGYSMGTFFAYFANLDQKKCLDNWPAISNTLIHNPNIHTVISIGGATPFIRPDNIFDIMGEEDILVPPKINQTLLHMGKQSVINNMGHLKLIQSHLLYQHIIRILTPNGKIKSPSYEDDKIVMQKDDIINNDFIKVIPEKKRGCLHRFFYHKKIPLVNTEATQSSYKPRLSRTCAIL